jgi:IS5 family transposase
VKASIVVTHNQGLIVGARTFPGNSYDGHTLTSQIEQTTMLMQDLQVKPTTAVVDLRYRGVDDLVPGEIIQRVCFKTMAAQQRRSFKPRQGIAPVSGHLKADHWGRLKAADGDAIYAVLCATGFNLKWLLRAVAHLGQMAISLLLQPSVTMVNGVRQDRLSADRFVRTQTAG